MRWRPGLSAVAGAAGFAAAGGAVAAAGFSTVAAGAAVGAGALGAPTVGAICGAVVGAGAGGCGEPHAASTAALAVRSVPRPMRSRRDILVMTALP
jgi:hypothetical protein